MGLHAGRVALGQVGYEDTTTFSAVGEVVNTASRLQDHSKVVGARLVADDRTILTAAGDALIATCPHSLRGLIEARGVGILHADPVDSVALVLAVDMDQTEAQRLPPFRSITFAGRTITLVHSVPSPHFPAALMQYLRVGRQA